MSKRSKIISAALLGLWCLSVLMSPLQAASPEKLRDLTAEEGDGQAGQAAETAGFLAVRRLLPHVNPPG